MIVSFVGMDNFCRRSCNIHLAEPVLMPPDWPQTSAWMPTPGISKCWWFYVLSNCTWLSVCYFMPWGQRWPSAYASCCEQLPMSILHVHIPVFVSILRTLAVWWGVYVTFTWQSACHLQFWCHQTGRNGSKSRLLIARACAVKTYGRQRWPTTITLLQLGCQQQASANAEAIALG